MMWQPIPRPTSWSSSARVEMLWGQPEQKYGVRGAGGPVPRSIPPRSMRIGAARVVAVHRQTGPHGKVLVPPQARQRSGHDMAGHRTVARDEGPPVRRLPCRGCGVARVVGTTRT